MNSYFVVLVLLLLAYYYFYETNEGVKLRNKTFAAVGIKYDPYSKLYVEDPEEYY